jgi:hypothetical protein
MLLLLLLTACNSKLDEYKTEKNSASQSKISTKTQNTVVLNFDTLKINNQKYIQIQKKGHFNSLLSLDKDTIIKAKDEYFKLELIDINEDGYQDLRVFTLSNTPNECENYLFDTTRSSFTLIENCDLDIKKVKGTNFYYSYNRAGCADLNWESRLSKIENYKLVDYGYIHGQGCDFEIEKNPQIIEIYKVNHSDKEEKTLMNKLPYEECSKKFGDKWHFIENYWNNNNKKFER